MAKKYSLLVIDDDLGIREAAYNNSFANDPSFELHFVREPRMLEEYIKIRPDGYLLDIVLDQGPWGREQLTAAKVIDAYLSKGKKSPVFLISDKWSNPDTLTYVNDIKSRHRDIVSDFFAWSWFACGQSQGNDQDNDQDSISAVKGKLRVILDDWHRCSAYIPAKNQPLRILHLSDLQFGDPSVTEDAFQSEQVIANILLNEGKPPNFIVVTGDIAYSGAPWEYEEAKKWFENALLRRLWPHGESVDRDRLLVVPGNHDVNLSLCLADRLEYNFDCKTPAELPVKPRMVKPPKGEKQQNHHKYGIEPFLRFAEEISYGGRWRENCKSCNSCNSWVSNRFAHLGIQFILLNTAYSIDAWNPDKVDISADVFDLLSDMLEEPDCSQDLFRILLLHHPFEERKKSVWTPETKKRFNSFLGTNHIDLLLAGHSHGFMTGTLPTSTTSGRPGMPYVHTATLKLGPEARPGEDRRGFVLLELYLDENGRVFETCGKFYELLPGKIGLTIDIRVQKRLA